MGTLGTLLGLAGTVDVAASCSLLHVPLDVTLDTDLDGEIAGWLSFARQKLHEIVTLRRGLTEGHSAISNTLHVNASRLASRATFPIVRVPAVRDRVAAITNADLHRASPHGTRRRAQQARLQLPELPTTTIGSVKLTADLGW